jgi:hypothetical protein
MRFVPMREMGEKEGEDGSESGSVGSERVKELNSFVFRICCQQFKCALSMSIVVAFRLSREEAAVLDSAEDVARDRTGEELSSWVRWWDERRYWQAS